MIKLSKLFSREKGIWYAYLWNESDRMGFERYLGYKVKNNLFIRENDKLSVWYNSKETEIISQKIKNKFLYDKDFVDKIFQDLDCEWSHVDKYIERGKQIKSANELNVYYTHLVKWWSAMNLLFRLDLPEDLSKSALEYRKKAEKFSDRMIEVWDRFWNGREQYLQKIMNLVTPEEAFAIDDFSQREIALIAAREKGVALLNSALYPLGQIGNILKENNLKLEKEVIENIKEFKGIVAFKGVASGLVKIVLFGKDISKIRLGEILVSDMTRPDFLPAIKKSSAIITDEGGITSHAAIVAREMKKPCIIGTKIATKVLKDGDLVEVDADRGIIKIIKKSKK